MRYSLDDWRVKFRVPNQIYLLDCADTLYMTVPLRSANGARSRTSVKKLRVKGPGGTDSDLLFTDGSATGA
jgi:hypothetical protein